jgi:xylulokinase
MALVMGVDSSTQSCKVVVRDSESGALVRHGRAEHPDGTEIEPTHWEVAVQAAIAEAGGMRDLAAFAVGGQQHGMVCLDEHGNVVRPALLWNDSRSAKAAADLVEEHSAQFWADAVGSVLVASLTITKLRWLAEFEPENAKRVVAVCLPHDWVTWRLSGSHDLTDLVTDRSDASGTGYWSPASGEYRLDLLREAFGRELMVPRVLGPADHATSMSSGRVIGPGAGDNAAAALGVSASYGDVVVSVGTSGVVSAVSASPTADPTGLVAGFASATGDFLPLACTLNGAGVLSAVARMLGVDHDELSRLALSAPAGSEGLVLVPYLEGERTPNLPNARGGLHGLRVANTIPANVARAAFEGLLCGLADAVDALTAQHLSAERFILVGGAAASGALCQLAPTLFGGPVTVPEAGEYVADGAARQAAWVLSGAAEPPDWPLAGARVYEGPSAPDVRARYAEVRELTIR